MTQNLHTHRPPSPGGHCSLTLYSIMEDHEKLRAELIQRDQVDRAIEDIEVWGPCVIKDIECIQKNLDQEKLITSKSRYNYCCDIDQAIIKANGLLGSAMFLVEEIRRYRDRH